MRDFNTKIIIPTSDKNKVFNALTKGITEWWTEILEGNSNQEGQSFTVRFGKNIFKTMLIKELIPNERIVWHFTDSLIDIPTLKNKTEWIDTKIVWDLSVNNNEIILNLTHFGLTPQVECYIVCENGWYSFTESLCRYINTGKGNAYKKSNN